MNSSYRIDEALDVILSKQRAKVKGLMEKVASGARPLSGIDVELRALLFGSGAQMLREMLEIADERLCKGMSVFEVKEKTVVTLVGKVRVRRRVCREGQEWRYPLNEALALEGKSPLSASLREATSLLASETSFERSAELLEKTTGIKMSAPAFRPTAARCMRRTAGTKSSPPRSIPPRPSAR